MLDEVATPGGTAVLGYEVDGFRQCAQLRRTNVADTIHMPDCVALYAFCKYSL